MTAIAWAEGADEELASALGDYRWLKAALRKLRFPRHPAGVLSLADRRQRTAEERLARLGRRRELPELQPLVELQLRCDNARDAVMAETIATAKRLEIEVSDDPGRMLRAIYRSPDRWPARPVTAPRGPAMTAWYVIAGTFGSLQLLGGLLLIAVAPSAWRLFAVPVVSGALLVASLFVWWRAFAGVLGVIGSVISSAALIFVLTLFHGKC